MEPTQCIQRGTVASTLDGTVKVRSYFMAVLTAMLMLKAHKSSANKLEVKIK
jgi:hypothetical protein